jgi:exopolysaccharide production protein ExoQ
MISQGTQDSPWYPGSSTHSALGNTRITGAQADPHATIDVPTRFEKNFIAAVLFFGTGAFTAFSIDSSGTIVSQEDLLSRSIWIAIYAVLFCLIAKRAKTIWRFFLQQKLLIALLLWVFASTLWSDAAAMTIRRATALLATTILGVYVAERFTLKQQMKMLLLSISCIAFLSLAAGILFPKIAIMSGIDTAGAWRGIVGHKNMLGRLMAISIVLCFISSALRKWKFVILPVSALLLILSHSGTAILSIGVLLICLPAIWLLRQSKKVLIIGGSFFSVAMIVLITYGYFHAGEIAFAILDKLGKTSTLSGRGPLWFLCLKYISQRPWLGYGYNAFWLGADGQYSSQIWKILGWEVPHAHNGFLQLCLDVGIIGLALFSILYIIALIRSVNSVTRARTRESMWGLVFLIFLLLANISETALLSGNSTFWILFVSVIYSSSMYYSKSSSPDINERYQRTQQQKAKIIGARA